MTNHIFDRITILGLGLIGSSIARAAHDKKLARHIVASDRNEVSLAFARKQGFIDTALPDPAAAVKQSDLVILAAPPAALGALAEVIAPHLKEGAIIMDVCSIKQAAIAAIAPHLPETVEFFPAHPIAGSEQAGVTAGKSNLFERKLIVITPEQPQHSEALQKIMDFWKAIGARVEAMPPHLHDLIYAYVSHLPQLLAFAVASLLSEHMKTQDESLRKFLRLCKSSPALWAEIFSLNHVNLLKGLDRYLDVLHHIRRELKQGPTGETNEHNIALVNIVLFPRIAASCLITTVMEAEKQAGFPFARYAGAGFTDFTSPAAIPPDEDIEHISNQYAGIIPLLDNYLETLKHFRNVLESGDMRKLAETLHHHSRLWE